MLLCSSEVRCYRVVGSDFSAREQEHSIALDCRGQGQHHKLHVPLSLAVEGGSGYGTVEHEAITCGYQGYYQR